MSPLGILLFKFSAIALVEKKLGLMVNKVRQLNFISCVTSNLKEIILSEISLEIIMSLILILLNLFINN